MVHQQNISRRLYSSDPFPAIEDVSVKKNVLLADSTIGSIRIFKLKGDAISKKTANTPGISPFRLSVIATAADSNTVAKKVSPIAYLPDTDNLFKKIKKRQKRGRRRPG